MTSGLSFNKVTKWLTVTRDVPIWQARSFSFRALPEAIKCLYSFAKCIGLRYLRRCGVLCFCLVSSVMVKEKVLVTSPLGEPMLTNRRTKCLIGYCPVPGKHRNRVFLFYGVFAAGYIGLQGFLRECTITYSELDE